MSPYGEVQIESFGAYIFYNNKWNLRAEYTPKDFARFFDTKGATLREGEPYTFVKNWRKSAEIFPGWALWYFIGRNKKGEQVMGYARLETTNQYVAAATNFSKN